MCDYDSLIKFTDWLDWLKKVIAIWDLTKSDLDLMLCISQ